ncbi:uncharacterized protein LOC124365034 [Homalodisca vitripennis]|uniref:uncharacterized protein LOC124365034 n=1 Tax=Homalodisca vitripennis TaxID=197043 RepID=UPI001EEC5F34|nr:uncharacterized protein LOC124365034 [Homalodisca vitripennis]
MKLWNSNPNAQEILKNKAKQLMRQNEARERKMNREDSDNNLEPASKFPRRMLPDSVRILTKYSKCRYPKNSSRSRVRTSVYCTKPFSEETEYQKLMSRSFSVDLGDLQIYQKLSGCF